MYYINAIASITHQDTFDKTGFSSELKVLEHESELIPPAYKEYIAPKLLRRMSKILRMSVACSLNCLKQAGDVELDAIIVGTGLGCLTDTQKFLENYITIEGLLPPTSFIQSTHNTIAGQISLTLGNKNYNITHTQSTVSFEMALQDAMMCLDEGMDNVLVGVADEAIPFLTEALAGLGIKGLNLTTGATFFILSKEKTGHTLAEIKACASAFNPVDKKAIYNQFLESNNIEPSAINQVYSSQSFNVSRNSVINEEANEIDVTAFAGAYPTNSAFGLHMAVDAMRQGTNEYALVKNNLSNKNLGFTLIKSVK